MKTLIIAFLLCICLSACSESEKSMDSVNSQISVENVIDEKTSAKQEDGTVVEDDSKYYLKISDFDIDLVGSTLPHLEDITSVRTGNQGTILYEDDDYMITERVDPAGKYYGYRGVIKEKINGFQKSYETYENGLICTVILLYDEDTIDDEKMIATIDFLDRELSKKYEKSEYTVNKEGQYGNIYELCEEDYVSQIISTDFSRQNDEIMCMMSVDDYTVPKLPTNDSEGNDNLEKALSDSDTGEILTGSTGFSENVIYRLDSSCTSLENAYDETYINDAYIEDGFLIIDGVFTCYDTSLERTEMYKNSYTKHDSLKLKITESTQWTSSGGMDPKKNIEMDHLMNLIKDSGLGISLTIRDFELLEAEIYS